jgi:hypothetical protein
MIKIFLNKQRENIIIIIIMILSQQREKMIITMKFYLKNSWNKMEEDCVQINHVDCQL